MKYQSSVTVSAGNKANKLLNLTHDVLWTTAPLQMGYEVRDRMLSAEVHNID